MVMKRREESESKVTEILRNASRGSSEIERLEDMKRKERQEFEKEKERLEKELEEETVFCPTCSHHEHEHKLKKTDKGTLKCTGDSCSEEYALISTTPDHICTECGAPRKKSLNPTDDSNCPLCGNNTFVKSKIDYKKIREQVAKKQKK